MNLQEYKPLIRITDFDGNTYFSEKSLDDFSRIANQPDIKFVKLRDELIAVSGIKKVEKYKPAGFEYLSKENRIYMENRVKEHQKKFAEYPSDKQINHWIDTELNQQPNG